MLKRCVFALGFSFFAVVCWLGVTPQAMAAISPQFSAARTSCVAPCAIFFDATATTGDGLENPYHELDYAWDFGDAKAGSWTYGSEDTQPGAGMTAIFTGSISGTTLTVTGCTQNAPQPGQVFTGTGVAPGTKITTGASGQPCNATYKINNAQTVPSTLLTSTQPYTTTVWNTDRNRAYGPIAVHLFKTPGTHQVRLTVTGPSGAVTPPPLAVTVIDPDVYFGGRWNEGALSFDVGGERGSPPGSVGGTICISSSGDFTGAPPGARRLKFSRPNDWEAIMSYLNGNTARANRVLLRRGDTFTAGSPQVVSKHGPGLLGSFGTGPLPVVKASKDIDNVLTFNRGVNDWRIVDIKFDGNGHGVGGIHIADQKQVLFYNLNFTTLYSVGQAGGGAYPASADQFFVINTSARNLISPSSKGYPGISISGLVERSAWMGNDWENSTKGQQILRIQNANKIVVNHNWLGQAQTSKVVFLYHGDTHTCNAGGCPRNVSHRATGQYVTSDNFFTTCTSEMIYQTPEGWITQDSIFESNFIVAPCGVGGYAAIRAQKVTWRNNIWAGINRIVTGGGHMVTIDSPGTFEARDLWIYNNTFFSDAKTNEVTQPVRNSGTKMGGTVSVKNLLVYAGSGACCVTVVHPGPNSILQSNNSTASQATRDNPNFSNTSGTFLNPATDYLPTAGYAIGGGTKDVPVYRDFNRQLITTATPNIGAVQK